MFWAMMGIPESLLGEQYIKSLWYGCATIVTCEVYCNFELWVKQRHFPEGLSTPSCITLYYNYMYMWPCPIPSGHASDGVCQVLAYTGLYWQRHLLCTKFGDHADKLSSKLVGILPQRTTDTVNQELSIFTFIVHAIIELYPNSKSKKKQDNVWELLGSLQVLVTFIALLASTISIPGCSGLWVTPFFLGKRS